LSTDLSVSDLDLPGAADVDAYRERGWYVTAPIVPHDMLDRMRLLVDEHQHRLDVGRLPHTVGMQDWRPLDGDGLRNNEFITLQEPRFAELTLLPIIGAIACRLAGTPSVRLFDDQALAKPPGDDDAFVGWHTDRAYWTNCSSRQMLTAWVPFEDSTVDNGTLMVVDGSHRWDGVEHLRHFHDGNLDRLSVVTGGRATGDAITSIELRKGQVSFHHEGVLHASRPNRSSATRLALAVHLQPQDNEFRQTFSPAGDRVVLPADRLCRTTPDGRPDYSDPAVFPQLWP